MSLRALEVIEIFKFLQAISPAGHIFVSWAHEERANERPIFDTFFGCDIRNGHHSKAKAFKI